MLKMVSIYLHIVFCKGLQTLRNHSYKKKEILHHTKSGQHLISNKLKLPVIISTIVNKKSHSIKIDKTFLGNEFRIK